MLKKLRYPSMKVFFSKKIVNARQYSNKLCTILGIETSCDDTGVAIVSSDRRILAERLYSQWSEHKKQGKAPKKNQNFTSFPGGVVPDLARQLHSNNLIKAVSECIEEVECQWSQIDALALTVKPGIEPCLWEGIKLAKLLLKKHNLTFIPIHHMEAHALTCRLFDANIKYPFLTLLISGGHCLLALVESYNNFERLGECLDVSPGNCIDRIARQLGLFEIESDSKLLSGGALVEYNALKGDPNYFPLIIQMARNYCFKHKDCQFSFTGLLVALNRIIDKLISQDSSSTRTIMVSGQERKILAPETISNICATLQNALTIQMEDRIKRALMYLKIRKVDVKHVVVSGGVASNKFIRSRLTDLVENEFKLKISCPPVNYCTDNGVMIAWNGCEKLKNNSNDCFSHENQNEDFFETIKPLGQCELGSDKTLDLKLLNIKINKK